MTLLEELVADLRAESAALDAIVSRLQHPEWATGTPAEGWDVQDQIWHLAWFDGAAYRAIAKPAASADEHASAVAGIARYADDVVRRGREQQPEAVLSRWREESKMFQSAALEASPRTRVGWFDTEMSVASLVTARLMETWAHGQDVRDAFGLAPEISDRLRHVAHLGFSAMPYAFRAHGQSPPATPVRVELRLPSGGLCTFGPVGTADQVIGSALDFSLVVTQRRHLDDVELEVTGPTAVRWMSIAQSFAGPPGPGRAPGQFPPDRRA
jgi:uncharacterized protein (TIGR03084 family)